MNRQSAAAEKEYHDIDVSAGHQHADQSLDRQSPVQTLPAQSLDTMTNHCTG